MQNWIPKKGIGLIERVKQGFGKPDIIYVKNFILRTSKDVKNNDESEESIQQKSRGRRSRLIVVGKNRLQGVGKNRLQEVGKIRLIVVEKSELQKSEKPTLIILIIIILILVILTEVILILSIFQILPNSSQWI